MSGEGEMLHWLGFVNCQASVGYYYSSRNTSFRNIKEHYPTFGDRSVSCDCRTRTIRQSCGSPRKVGEAICPGRLYLSTAPCLPTTIRTVIPAEQNLRKRKNELPESSPQLRRLRRQLFPCASFSRS